MIISRQGRIQEGVRSRSCPELEKVFIQYMEKVDKPSTWKNLSAYADKMDDWLRNHRPEVFGSGVAYRGDISREYGPNWYSLTFRAAVTAVKDKAFWEKWSNSER